MHTAKLLALAAATAPVAVLCNMISIPEHGAHWRRGEDPDYTKAGKIDLATAVIGIEALVVNIIVKTIKGQQAQRAAYTKATAQELRSQFPEKNVVIFHNQHSFYDFVNGTHFHHEVDLFRSLGTYGYEIWVFDSGTFHLVGDGGYMNWSFGGNHTRIGDKIVEFYPIHPKPSVQPPGIPIDQLLPPGWPTRRTRHDHGGKPPRRSESGAEDGNYFVDCKADDGTMSSGIAYYKNLIPGQMIDKKPDDYVEVSSGYYIDWQSASSVDFSARNATVTWSILGDSENAEVDESCGVATNSHEKFWLYRSHGDFLFAEETKKCNAMYWGF